MLPNFSIPVNGCSTTAVQLSPASARNRSVSVAMTCALVLSAVNGGRAAGRRYRDMPWSKPPCPANRPSTSINFNVPHIKQIDFTCLQVQRRRGFACCKKLPCTIQIPIPEPLPLQQDFLGLKAEILRRVAVSAGGGAGSIQRTDVISENHFEHRAHFHTS
jgi:hypothetical protein